MKPLLFFGIIAVAIAIGASLECYDCYKCGDPFKGEGVPKSNCAAACMKNVLKLSNGVEFVLRTCAGPPPKMLRLDEYKDPLYIASSTMETCTDDLCNGALFGVLCNGTVPSIVPSTVPSIVPSTVPSIVSSTVPSIVPSIVPGTVASSAFTYFLSSFISIIISIFVINQD